MPAIQFELPVIPRGQGRPRATVRGRHARTYKDEASRDHEATIAALVAPYRPAAPIDGPVRVWVTALMPRPAALSRVSKRTGLPMSEPGRLPHTGKPDLDNICKSLLDGLSKAGFWLDDKQVWQLQAGKQIASMDEAPRYLVWIGWGDGD